MKFTTALPILTIAVLSSGRGADAFAQPRANTRVATAVPLNVLAEPKIEEPATTAPGGAAEEKKYPVKEMKDEASVENFELNAVQVDAAADRSKLQPGRYDTIDYSLTLPFLSKPTALDGSHAGDYGFDPFGFSETYDLYTMQEAELRHGRLAMLAVVGWPLSELLAPKFMLTETGCAPSVLNGFNPLSFLAVVAAFGGLGYFEKETALRRTVGTKLGDVHRSDTSNIWKHGVAGDYDFDPLNLYNSFGDDAWSRKGMRELEVSHGRWAMMGITYFALWEALTKSPIVKDNMFFEPNLLLPTLALGYAAWSQIYQVSDLREYPITIEYTKDGEDILRGIDRTTAGWRKEAAAKAEEWELEDKVDDLIKKVQAAPLPVKGGAAGAAFLLSLSLALSSPAPPQQQAPATPAKVAAPVAATKVAPKSAAVSTPAAEKTEKTYASSPFFAKNVATTTETTKSASVVQEVKKAAPVAAATKATAATATKETPAKKASTDLAAANKAEKETLAAKAAAKAASQQESLAQSLAAKQKATEAIAKAQAAKVESDALQKEARAAAQAKASSHAFGVVEKGGKEYGGRILPQEEVGEEVLYFLKQYGSN